MINEVNDYIKKTISENRLAHAFLIETNNLELALKEVKELIKYIFNFQIENNEDNNINNLVDKELIPSLKIIRPDGTQIKKEQTKELLSSFKYNSIYTEKMIYVIYDAEKLNDSSANCLLKFIEEPETDIVGFFIVRNADNVIPTIKSRCIKLNCYYDSKKIEENLEVSKEEFDRYKLIANNILKKIVAGDDMLKDNRDIFLSIIDNKTGIEKVFKIVLDEVEIELFRRNKLAKKKEETDVDLSVISSKNIVMLLNILIAFLNDINYNVNMELFLDKFAIEVSKINE